MKKEILSTQEEKLVESLLPVVVALSPARLHSLCKEASGEKSSGKGGGRGVRLFWMASYYA